MKEEGRLAQNADSTKLALALMIASLAITPERSVVMLISNTLFGIPKMFVRGPRDVLKVLRSAANANRNSVEY